MALTLNEKKEYAWLLFKDGSYTQKMIAEKVGVSENSITDWKTKYNWDAKAKSIKQTREENLISLHNQCAAINEDIRLNKKGIPTSGDADIIRKLSASIRELENEVGYTEAYQVMKKFMLHIQKVDFAKAKELVPYADAFMQDTLKYQV